MCAVMVQWCTARSPCVNHALNRRTVARCYYCHLQQEMSIVPYDIAPIGAPAANLPRLLLVLTEFPPGFGDMQTHAVNLTKHLAARG